MFELFLRLRLSTVIKRISDDDDDMRELLLTIHNLFLSHYFSHYRYDGS